MPSDINVEASREAANRTNNIHLPIYTQPDDPHKKFDADISEQSGLDAVFSAAAGDYDQNTECEVMLDVFLAFARIAPMLHLVPAFHDPATADFHWSRLRCLFGAAGYKHHAKIADYFTRHYPLCGMRADETLGEWTTALAEAHRISGWPVALALAPWHKLVSAVSNVAKDSIVLPDWMRAVCILHILKHLRFSNHYGLVVTYSGRACFHEAPTDSNTLHRKQVDALSPLLGLPPARGKFVHPLTVQTTKVLRDLSMDLLLKRRPISDVPGFVLAGPWSRLVPDPVAMSGFVQHGLRLTHVWVAEGGKVEPVPGGSAEVLGFDWNLKPTVEAADARRRYEASLPREYDTHASPAAIFLHAFPNVAFTRYGLNPMAFSAVFAATICAGMMRAECPSLGRERPFMLFMPANPNPDDATNQGKTYAADVIANAFVPGIGRGKALPNTNSAPDMRAIAGDVEQFGTLNIDEWLMPTAPQHILCHRNLQTLLVGGEVNVGKAFENASFPVALKYPLVANTKVFSVPPDLVNRCLPTFMETFTDEQRSRGDVLAEVETGCTSVRIRLAALGMIERLGLADFINAGSFNTTNTGSRYQGIRALSIKILRDAHRLTEAEATTAIDVYMQGLRTAVGNHTREAEASGLVAQQTEGDAVAIRTFSLFAEIGIPRLMELIDIAKHESPDNGAHGLTPSAILKARLTVAGSGNALNLAPILQILGIRQRNVSDRVLSLAFARDLRSLMPDVGNTWLLPDICGERSWKMVRMSDSGGAFRCRFENNAPPTHQG